MIEQHLIDEAKRTDLLALAGVELRRIASTGGGEYAGPCPMCGGRDRFHVQPDQALWFCRHCTGGAWRDPIDLVRQRDGASFAHAVEVLTHGVTVPGATPATPPARKRKTNGPPSPAWQAQARAFVDTCRAALWEDSGLPALLGLRSRGLEDETIKAAGLGWNAHDRRPDKATWGLDGDGKLWLPRGIVIPWEIGGELWRVNVRRPRADIGEDGPKYIGPAGCCNALYNADELRPGCSAVIVEGELDALTIAQHAGALAPCRHGIVPVATGSVTWARRTRWAARLALADQVLVCFDADEPGNDAADYWLQVLPQAHRWRPWWEDANAMARAGVDLRRWIALGLAAAAGHRSFETLEAATGAALVALSDTPTDPERFQCYKRFDDLWAAALGLPEVTDE